MTTLSKVSPDSDVSGVAVVALPQATNPVVLDQSEVTRFSLFSRGTLVSTLVAVSLANAVLIGINSLSAGAAAYLEECAVSTDECGTRNYYNSQVRSLYTIAVLFIIAAALVTATAGIGTGVAALRARYLSDSKLREGQPINKQSRILLLTLGLFLEVSAVILFSTKAAAYIHQYHALTTSPYQGVPPVHPVALIDAAELNRATQKATAAEIAVYFSVLGLSMVVSYFRHHFPQGITFNFDAATRLPLLKSGPRRAGYQALDITDAASVQGSDIADAASVRGSDIADANPFERSGRMSPTP